jgi:hypothetical protein
MGLCRAGGVTNSRLDADVQFALTAIPSIVATGEVSTSPKFEP